jgi:hypothetical protein
MGLIPKWAKRLHKIPDDTHIGCGVYPLITSEKDPMLPACAWHDKAYVEGSWQQHFMTRKEVDDEFLRRMLELAGSSLLLKARAYTYYGLVRACGGPFWEGEK